MILKSTKRNLIILSTMLAVFSLSSCDLLEEPQIPTWTNSIEFPLISTSVNLDVLRDKDNIRTQLYENGDSIFAYADTTVMDTQAVTDQLTFEDINKAFSQSVDDVNVAGSSIIQATGFDPVGVDPIQENVNSVLGPIELSDIPEDSTDPVLLNEVVSDVNSIPDGQKAVIDSTGLDPVEKPFTFSDFQSASFSGGVLDITINNNMVIALGNPINIVLKDGATPIVGATVVWTPLLPAEQVQQSL